MSGLLMGQVWHLELPAHEQRVLLAFADHADDEGYDAYPSLDYVAWKLGTTRRQIQRTIASLREKGILEVLSPHTGWSPTVYRINIAAAEWKRPYAGRDLPRPRLKRDLLDRQDRCCFYCSRRGTETQGPDGRPWELDRLIPGERGGTYHDLNVVLSCGPCNRAKGTTTIPGIDGATGTAPPEMTSGALRGDAERHVRGDTAMSPEPSIEPTTTVSSAREADLGKRAVNRKVVAKDEWALAAAILERFNAKAGTRYTLEAHFVPIVGRIREHPEMAFDEHARVIDAAFEKPWWSGAAGVQVIYGSQGQFERQIQVAEGVQGPRSREDERQARRRDRAEALRELSGLEAA